MHRMATKTPPVAGDWYAHSFDALYPVIYAHRSVEAAAREVRFTARELGLQPTDWVLDLACGNGRHMVHLLEKAQCVFGLDYSGALLELAKQVTGCRALTVRADMRAIPFAGVFDVLVNFFTSFGYFLSEEDDLEVVRGIAWALKPGGRFLIDYVNRAHAERTLVPRSARKVGAYEIHELRTIDRANGRINKATVVFENRKKIGEFQESVRLYHLEAFCELLTQGGLHVDQLFGDYSGAPLDPARPRMIAIGHRT